MERVAEDKRLLSEGICPVCRMRTTGRQHFWKDDKHRTWAGIYRRWHWKRGIQWSAAPPPIALPPDFYKNCKKNYNPFFDFEVEHHKAPRG